MKAIVTVGLGFGDEGKGATVDFLTRHYGAQWVVRYSGGAQAGHNVQLPDGRRHTFSQFGAGTLAGAQTYLGPRVVVCPLTLRPEANHLRELGLENPRRTLTMHPDCLLATTYHMSMNRMREIDRGGQRHGSCGLGIGESRSYWLRYGLDAVFASDLGNRSVLVNKLRLMRDRMLLEMQNLERVNQAYAQSIYRARPHDVAEQMIDDMQDVGLSSCLPTSDVLIFEASQGILLDEYTGFHPFTTWSTVSTLHAQELIDQSGITDVWTLGLTRAYTTRHGAGPFPTACAKMTDEMLDPGNPENDWQGGMRSGPLDMMLLRYAAATEILDGIVVSHLDELSTTPRVCNSYQGIKWLEHPRTIAEQKRLTGLLENCRPVIEDVTKEELIVELEKVAPVVITASGPTHLDRQFVQCEIATSN